VALVVNAARRARLLPLAALHEVPGLCRVYPRDHEGSRAANQLACRYRSGSVSGVVEGEFVQLVEFPGSTTFFEQ
jgi:hypothetical protein